MYVVTSYNAAPCGHRLDSNTHTVHMDVVVVVGVVDGAQQPHHLSYLAAIQRQHEHDFHLLAAWLTAACGQWSWLPHRL